MDDIDPAPLVEPEPGDVLESRPWLISFADLICLLLSTFVMLAHASSIQSDRAHHAMQSIGQTLVFGTADSDHAAHQSEGEAIAGPAAARDRLSAQIHALVPAAKMENLPAGTALRFTVPVDVLFVGKDLRPQAKRILAAIAEALAQNAPGYRFEAEIVAGAGATPEARQTGIAHSSALARELTNLGAVKTAVAAGLDPGPENEIRVTVRAHSDDEPRIDFHHLVTGQ